MIWNFNFHITAVICASILAACAMPAKNSKTLLQAIVENEKFESSEGGESRLFRVENNGVRHCQIETQIFGETGRTDQVFKFNQNFSRGTIIVYRYEKPLYIDPNAKAVVTSKLDVDIASNHEIKYKFDNSKNLFSARKIQYCLNLN